MPEKVNDKELIESLLNKNSFNDQSLNKLKDKNDEEDNFFYRYRRYILFSSPVVIVLIVLGVSAIIGSDTTKLLVKTTNTVETSKDAYFKPSKDAKNMFKGKVEYVSETLDDAMIKHKIVDENDQILAYIYSTKNDLNLSVGLIVEIQGKVISKKVNNISVIEVDSLKLK